MDLTRRNVLAAGALGAAGVALTGCAGDGSTSTPTAQGGVGGASPAQPGTSLVSTADVPVASGVIVPAGETKVVVTQPTSGEFVGLSAVCPHQNCLVGSVDGERIICPCHGSQFSVTDGSVLQGPATTGLAPVAVTVEGDQVVLG